MVDQIVSEVMHVERALVLSSPLPLPSWWMRLLLLAALAVTAIAPGPVAHAAGTDALGTTGFDVSFPQCADSLAALVADPSGAPFQFAVVGVNHGRPFSQNPCLARQYQTVTGRGLTPSLYLNLDAPRDPSRWLDSVGSDEACAPDDLACAYTHYGRQAAADADAYAWTALQSIGVSTLPTTWWLDVENSNYWSPDPSLNARVIQGAIDYLQGQTVAGTNGTSDSATSLTVGIYSVPAMWRQIAGASYQPGVPAWVAGATSFFTASRLCVARSFTGGPIWLVQYRNGRYDGDLAC